MLLRSLVHLLFWFPIYVKTYSICLSLTYFTKHNTLQIHPCCCKLQNFTFLNFLGNIPLCIYMCVYIYMYIYVCCCCQVASVVSDSVWPHRRQPTRLPRPWDSPGKNWSGLPFPSPMHESEKWKWSHSVVSDSSRPHGLQPSRLLRPWDFPGKSTGVGHQCLLHIYLYTCIYIYTHTI